jgi:hypothetical protein
MRLTKPNSRSERAGQQAAANSATASSAADQDPLVWRWLTQPRLAPPRRPLVAGILAALYLGWLAILLAMAIS